jgi:hypothetical protein
VNGTLTAIGSAIALIAILVAIGWVLAAALRRRCDAATQGPASADGAPGPVPPGGSPTSDGRDRAVAGLVGGAALAVAGGLLAWRWRAAAPAADDGELFVPRTEPADPAPVVQGGRAGAAPDPVGAFQPRPGPSAGTAICRLTGQPRGGCGCRECVDRRSTRPSP